MKLNNKFYIGGLVIVFIFLVTSVSFAGLSPQTIGMGDSFATITGADALYGNPAAVNAGEKVFVLELGGGVEAWNNLLANDYIENSEKDKLLKQISESGFVLRPATRAGGKLIIGPIGTAVDVRAEGITSLSSDVAELLLKGNELEQTYKLDGSAGIGGVYGDASINVSLLGSENVPLPGLEKDWRLKDLYVGFTYHQLTGGVISQVEGDGNIKLGYNDEGKFKATGDGEFIAKYNKPEAFSDMASGSAIDLGGYARINDKYSIGFSALRIGSLSAPSAACYSRTYKVVTTEDGRDIEVEKEGEEKLLGKSLTYRLPTTYRLGGKMNFTDSIDFFSDYSYTSYDLGSQTIGEHKISAATEITWLNFLPLRTGLNYSTLRNDFAWSSGLGLYLGPLKAEAGVSDLLGFFLSSHGVKGALNLKIEF